MTQEYFRPEHGMLHVYTGDGKGKTTSSFGLSIRAAGAGDKVLLIQFDKGPQDSGHYAERNILNKIENINLVPTGCDRFQEDGTFRFGIESEDIDEAQRGLEKAREGIKSGEYKLIVLDEIITSVTYKLISREDLQGIIDLWIEQGKNLELILTGRGASDWLIEQADLVTEMKKIKHYFDQGVLARKGVEF